MGNFLNSIMKTDYPVYFHLNQRKKRKQMGSKNDSNYTDFLYQINRQRIFKNHWNTINNQ